MAKAAIYIIFILLLGVAAAPTNAFANQLGFNRQYVGSGVALSFSWKDMYGQTRNLQFSLEGQAAVRGHSEFKAFDNSAANTAAYKAVKKYADKNDGLEVKRSFEGFRVEYKGQAYALKDTHAKNIEDIRKQAYTTDIERQFYMEFNGNVMPNHRMVAKRYVRAMAPVARAIRRETSGMDRREQLNFVLNFLQNIPYDVLMNRATSNGAGFQTPYGLLINNRGDCDTKAVALAAIMRNLYPSQRIVMVYVPNHAFVGMHGMPAKGDDVLRLGNAREPFVLMDPTGPALVPVGVTQSQAQFALTHGDYSYQEIPL